MQKLKKKINTSFNYNILNKAKKNLPSFKEFNFNFIYFCQIYVLIKIDFHKVEHQKVLI